MDLEHIEQFFVIYLKEKKLEYEEKNRIYTVKLDRQHKKWFGKDILTCTFDTKVSKAKKVELLGPGNSAFDSMVVQFADQVPIAALIIPKQADDIMEVNEALPTLNKEKVEYMIDEKTITAHYVLFEVRIQTAVTRHDYAKPVLVINGKLYDATGIDVTRAQKDKVDLKVIPTLTTISELLDDYVKEDIAAAKIEHEEKLATLKDTQYDFNKQQFKELEEKEWKLNYRIEELRKKALNARDFDSKRKYEDEQKKLKTKLAKLKEDNEQKKEKIKETHDDQMDNIEVREFSSEAYVQAFAQLQLPICEVNFTDKKTYYYVPILKKFLKK